MERLSLNLAKMHFSNENYATRASRRGVGFKKDIFIGYRGRKNHFGAAAAKTAA
jgi:hypothetical protein